MWQSRDLASLSKRRLPGVFVLRQSQDARHHSCPLRAHVRLYSTPVEKQSNSATTPASELPLAPATPRKSRVELRPSPRPVQSSSAGSTVNSSNAAPPPTSHVERVPRLLADTPPPSSPDPGIWETIREDFHSAEQLGIMDPPPEGASKLGQFWHRGSMLLRFYFRSVKLIVTNARAASALKKRVRSGGEPLTRAEALLVRTSADDVKRLVPFALIVLVLEEAVPFLVLYVPSLLPSTCILPSQKQRLAQKRAVRQWQALHNGQDALAAALQHPQGVSLEHLDARSVSALCGCVQGGSPFLRQCAHHYCRLFDISSWTPAFLRRTRVKSRLALIAEDDRLLQLELASSQSLAHLTENEVRDALAQRGLYVVFLPSRQMY